MRLTAPPVSRRTRQRIYAATALLSLALWLFMMAAESCTPLHAWLHGGSIPDDDSCAVVAIAHGKVDSVVAISPVPAPVAWIEITPRIVISDFRPATASLPDGRAPPVFFPAS